MVVALAMLNYLWRCRELSANLGMVRRKSSWLLLKIRFFMLFLAGSALAGSPQMVTLNDSSPYPEGPLARDGGVYYAEMGGDRVLFSNGDGTRLVWKASGCGPTSVSDYGSGFVVLCHQAGALAIISPTGETHEIVSEDIDGQRFVTPNASTADGRGGVYFSSSGAFAPGGPSTGAVLHLDDGGRLRRVAEGIHYSNGVALSPDGGTLYVSEHLSRNVLAYAVAPDGSLGDRQLYFSLDDLVGPDSSRRWDVGPDGLAVDDSGNLFVAEYGAGRVLIVSPEKELVATVKVDEQYVTAPALSPDGVTLFVTAPSARNPSQPGKVYAIGNPVRTRD